MSRYARLAAKLEGWPRRHDFSCPRLGVGGSEPDDGQVCTCGVQARRRALVDVIRLADARKKDGP
jgi:hypothetical protein